MSIKIGKLLDPTPILDILDNIDHYRFSLETRKYPRKEYFKGTLIGRISQVNREQDISNGYKYINSFSKKDQIKVKLDSVSGNNWKIFRKCYSEPTSPWFLVRLNGGNLIQLDLDAHEKNISITESKNKRDKTLLDITSYLDSKKISYLVTTSPGDVFGFNKNNDILHGYYIWIKTHIKYSSKDLLSISNKLVDNIKEHTGHIIEHNWQEIRSRNTRLFGQLFVDPVIVDNNKIVRKYISGFYDSTDLTQHRANQAFLAWSNLKTSELLVNNSDKVELIKSKKYYVKQNVKTDANKANPNAFRRLVGRKYKNDSILSKIIRKYDGRSECYEKIVKEATDEFVELSKSSNFLDHVSNPARLDTLVRRVSTWFLKTYHKSKSEKIDYSQFVVDKDVLSKIINLKYEKKYSKAILKMYSLCIKWDGFVAAKSIYGKNGICSKRVWKVIKEVFTVNKDFSKSNRKCRQYVLNAEIRVTCSNLLKKGSIGPPPLTEKEQDFLGQEKDVEMHFSTANLIEECLLETK